MNVWLIIALSYAAFGICSYFGIFFILKPQPLISEDESESDKISVPPPPSTRFAIFKCLVMVIIVPVTAVMSTVLSPPVLACGIWSKRKRKHPNQSET
jgi:hypothetical protein